MQFLRVFAIKVSVKAGSVWVGVGGVKGEIVSK